MPNSGPNMGGSWGPAKPPKYKKPRKGTKTVSAMRPMGKRRTLKKK